MPECPRCCAFTENSETRSRWRRLIFRWLGRRSFKCPVCGRYYSILNTNLTTKRKEKSRH